MMLLNTPAPSLPIGSILAYAGVLGDIPTGWAICDGSSGTPDLTDSFVMGGTLAQKGQTGGANSVTPSGSVGINVNVNNHTLSASQMPSHGHSISFRYFGRDGSIGLSGTSWTSARGTSTGGAGSSGAHNHSASGSGSFNGSQQDNKPKYYKSAYIMRVS